MNIRTLAGCVLILAFISSCANVDMNKGKQGALGGAAGGALIGQAIGGNTEATLIGAAIGTMLGYIVGNEMDKYDRERLSYAYEYGRSGEQTSWQNPDTGSAYTVVPQEAYANPVDSRRPCRKAEIIANIDGKPEKTFATACRTPSGEWELQ